MRSGSGLPHLLFLFWLVSCNTLILSPSDFSVKGSRPGKNVQLTENEIRGLCLKSREIFLSQPILLELEAPLKICGKYVYPVWGSHFKRARNVMHCECQRIYIFKTSLYLGGLEWLLNHPMAVGFCGVAFKRTV